MAKKAACKCKKAECEECPEWIFTFADLVMLMMGFFVILWVTKPSPTKQPHEAAATADDESDSVKLAATARVAFGFIPGAGDHDVVSNYIRNHDMRHVMLSGPHDGGKTQEEKGINGTSPTVENIRKGPHVTIGGKMLFGVGSASLTPETKAGLEQFAKQVKGWQYIVMIKGHTSLDDFPEEATTQQKMDLSIKRAQAAEDYMIQQGVEPKILRVQGCSIFEPLRQRSWEASSQEENRRIEVEVTSSLVEDLAANATTRPAQNP